jgi:hypothetical protein
VISGVLVSLMANLVMPALNFGDRAVAEERADNTPDA